MNTDEIRKRFSEAGNPRHLWIDGLLHEHPDMLRKLPVRDIVEIEDEEEKNNDDGPLTFE